MKKFFAIIVAFAIACMAAAPASACYGDHSSGPTATDCGATEQAEKILDHFSIDSTLDFGRITELDRSYTKYLTVSNFTKNDVIVDATVEAYAEADGKSQELSDWIAFVGGVSHFSVAKGSNYTLGVRAVVPSDAVPGSQYALIKLTDASGYAAEVIARLDIAGDGLKYDSEVSGAWIDPVHLDENLNATATIKNKGTAGFTASFQIKSKGFFGGDWQVIAEESAEVLPNKEYSFRNDSKLGFGVYNVEQRVTYVNSEGRMVESLTTRIVVNLPWWAIAIAGGVLLLIIIVVIIAKKKGKNRNNDEPKKIEKAPKVTEDVVEEIEEEKPVEKEPAKEPAPAVKPAARPVAKPAISKPKPVKKVIKIQ